jgi:CubicO group peptidase (beta-lactamase class C family)
MTRIWIWLAAFAAACFSLAAAAQPAPGPDPTDRAAAYAVDQMRQSGVPGFAVAIVKGADVRYLRAFGVAGPTGEAVSADTPFILGSTTKSFTALCVMQLVEAGKVDLDASASRYLPGFMGGSPAGSRITVRDLLNQTSGIGHAAGDQPMLSPGETGDRAIRNWAMALSPDALTATGYEYSNANYIVLGAVIEAASGETYGSYLKHHILAPLGMTSSFTTLAEGRAHKMASGHREWVGWFEAGEVPYPPAFVPAGFLITTPRDMTRYMSMQANGGELDGVRIISEKGLAETHRGAAPMDDEGKARYAMGWVSDTFNGVPAVYHDGDTGRFISELGLTRDGYGILIMANASGWLSGPHSTDALSGAINILAGKTPRSYATPYLIGKIVLAVPLGVALLQLLFLVRALANRRKPGKSAWGLGAPIVVSAALATFLAWAVPRLLFGIPLTEMIMSVPPFGAAALVSLAVAAAWLSRAVLLLARPSPVR